MKNQFAIGNFKLNKIFFLEAHDRMATEIQAVEAKEASNQACLSMFCKIMHQSSHSAQNGPNPTNKSLPKFTPIFLILPQTLVVCQNWLASNLEKDILRKCQKCRRMEDNSDWCSLVCPDHFKFTSSPWIFSRCPIKDIQFLMGSAHIWLKQWRIICTER